ncbi:AAA family ATPase [Mesoflavibacter sp. CH_XMU1422-2]|uniref:AAA family ATPase n=1 Tax=Mesoflavibacter sp. CH_XMU1422-2 TaxID=3107770 RepID=UPI00300BDAF1
MQDTKNITLSSIDKDLNITTSNSIKELTRSAKIDVNEKIEREPSVLSIDDISFGSLGNFSCVTGKSKSRKTFFISMLIAAAIDIHGKNQRIKTEIPKTNVIHFDTEQSKYDTQKVAKRVVELVDSKDCNEFYHCYCLRPNSPKERIKIIEDVIYNQSNIKMVVIDGIADLIVGYNNEDEAIKVISKFMKWTYDLNIHIITIVHQNKGDNNAKGHLGSLIYQKAQTVLDVEKDGEVSKVFPSHSRGIDINPLSFSVDKQGLPYFVDFIPTSPGTIKRTDPKDISLETHKKILFNAFDIDQTELARKDLISRIKWSLDIEDIPNGDDKCKEFLNYYKDNNLVFQEGTHKPYKLKI